MNFKIEKAGPRDVAEILQMLREFADFENLTEFCIVTEDKLQTAMFSDRPVVEGLIAFDESDSPAAYALFFENFASFRGQRGIYLEDLYVRPGYRGQGLGLIMLKHLAKLARARGCERMDWLVLDWNESAIRFYQKLGAKINSDEKHFQLSGIGFEKLASG